MELDKIQQLIKLANEHQLATLKLVEGETSVHITRIVTSSMPAVVTNGTPSSTLTTTIAKPSSGETLAAQITAPPSTTGHTVRSPMVGTAYLAPKPGAKPFVSVGQAVKPGDVLCIIEAMKMMNHIEADVAGIVKTKLIENAMPIEYDQALFIIE